MSPDTVLEILRASEVYLEGRGVDAPRRSAELLLGRVLAMPRLELYLAHDRPLSPDEKSTMRAWLARRGDHEPLAYVLGDHEFYGHELEVTPAVLIPRPETEGLVELAIERVGPGARCVDLGTGSGAIAIALALERDDVTVTAVDVSEAALEVARRNVERHGLQDRVTCRLGSFWAGVDADARFDLVISNPPYVDPARPELLADDVRRFEPELALFTPSGEPAAAYEAIAAGLSQHAAPDAVLLFETGVGASEPARRVIESLAGVTDVELRDDLAGLPRYVCARYGQPAD